METVKFEKSLEHVFNCLHVLGLVDLGIWTHYGTMSSRLKLFHMLNYTWSLLLLLSIFYLTYFDFATYWWPLDKDHQRLEMMEIISNAVCAVAMFVLPSFGLRGFPEQAVNIYGKFVGEKTHYSMDATHLTLSVITLGFTAFFASRSIILWNADDTAVDIIEQYYNKSNTASSTGSMTMHALRYVHDAASVAQALTDLNMYLIRGLLIYWCYQLARIFERLTVDFAKRSDQTNPYSAWMDFRDRYLTLRSHIIVTSRQMRYYVKALYIYDFFTIVYIVNSLLKETNGKFALISVAQLIPQLGFVVLLASSSSRLYEMAKNFVSTMEELTVSQAERMSETQKADLSRACTFYLRNEIGLQMAGRIVEGNFADGVAGAMGALILITDK
ncbi:uncharacterized protein LOC129597263 [Paramacrobiotus metropolitanus]|uniref:uncharacterized protein LOC129597263 n=1 Tax=Paramacrobiotus metropolitanus TaxID=2943436 RepID=UPI002445C0B4|nr:uncharacterized protein LOC129597263 [Paramacrobiotus metropolitanus]